MSEMDTISQSQVSAHRGGGGGGGGGGWLSPTYYDPHLKCHLPMCTCHDNLTCLCYIPRRARACSVGALLLSISTVFNILLEASFSAGAAVPEAPF